ncbi:Pyruvate kinase [Paramicrosporidium saccamoebae]|uniref:Pyruvate kinase n=1 Tax=Paramicrosporidium saccamoebae TaxID=1246581 RepID=A0A2H9TGE3_9FUNG|nr:Pyruvate kinase [Paramicrosporidium saccamoebae]
MTSSPTDSNVTVHSDSRVRCKMPPTGSRISWVSQLDIDATPACVRKTSIICTIGPKTNNVDSLIELRKAGMNIVRMNLSHGSHEYHGSVVENVRRSFEVFPGRPVALALDTKGPEIRSGELEGGVCLIPKDHVFILTTDEKYRLCGGLERVFVDYPQIGETLEPGKLVYVDDGNLQLEVLESLGSQGVKVRALNSHKLLNRKGVNLPYTKVLIPSVSEKDKQDLRFAVEQKMDMVFASFIRKPEDIHEIRKILGDSKILVIAKIENHEGVKNFDAILEEADGIMVARGDLGIEIPPQKVFVAQKMMIARANLKGKPAICATQMLESMTQNPRPTRAEASDVANAVLDGADCVMLSAETASGNYPVETVRTMASICAEAESTIAYLPLFEELRALIGCAENVTETIACSAVNAASETYVQAIIVLTTTGGTARQVAKFRPQVPIITVTREDLTARQIHLHRGCYPLVWKESHDPQNEWQGDVDGRFRWAISEAKRINLLKTGDHVVLIQGARAGHGHTNTLRILQVE